MKVSHVAFDGLVHRLVLSSNGLMAISCDAPEPEDGVDDTDEQLTCVQCISLDARATGHRLAQLLRARLGGT